MHEASNYLSLPCPFYLWQRCPLFQDSRAKCGRDMQVVLRELIPAISLALSFLINNFCRTPKAVGLPGSRDPSGHYTQWKLLNPARPVKFPSNHVYASLTNILWTISLKRVCVATVAYTINRWQPRALLL